MAMVLVAAVGLCLRLQLQRHSRGGGVAAGGEFPKQPQRVVVFFFITNSSCSSLPSLTGTQPLTQSNFPTRPETILVRVHHSPTLLLSPGITWLPNFSGNDPVCIHSLSR